jgi:HAD superfamily hydrolase (TIGR01509 family)
MVKAVLFDWGETLVHFEWEDELFAAGHRAGLAAVGLDDPGFTERYREHVLPRVGVDYATLLRELGVDDPDAFIDAEHAAWEPAHHVLGAAQALLSSLRERGLRTAVVANAWPEPARIVRGDMERYGLAAGLDAIVLAQESGVRKPAPEIFLRALAELGVDAADAVFVGDRLDHDVQGAADVGMTTVQALWFRADDHPSGVEPDFLAFTPMDVLNVVRRLGVAL